MKGKTVIAIAHRLSTLKEMNKIVVMEKGKIVEEGSHATLLRKKALIIIFIKCSLPDFCCRTAEKTESQAGLAVEPENVNNLGNRSKLLKRAVNHLRLVARRKSEETSNILWLVSIAINNLLLKN